MSNVIFEEIPILEPVVSPIGDTPQPNAAQAPTMPRISSIAAQDIQDVKTRLDGLDALINRAVTGAVSASLAHVGGVTKDLLADLRRTRDEIMADVAKASKANKTCLAVKIGDAPMRALSAPAHPELGLSLLMVKALHDSGTNTYLQLVGPAGCGKSTLAAQVAEALGLDFRFISMSEGVSESSLLGRQRGDGSFTEPPFVKVCRNGGLFFFDERDAANSNVMVKVNAALASRVLENDITGERIKLHENAYFMAAGNTFGKGANAVYTARNAQDGSNNDRFVDLEMNYLPEIEAKILPDEKLLKHVRDVRTKILEKGAREVVSYRFLSKLNTLVSAGLPAPQVLGMLTCHWPKHLVEETHVLTPPGKRSVKLDGTHAVEDAKNKPVVAF